MQIVDTALLIPIHTPHYPYIYDLIKKLKANNIYIDIFLVFSNHIDYKLFEMKKNIKPLIITGPLNFDSIVTFKKYYGLKQLIHSTYDYIICCDSEIDIIPENCNSENITEKLNAIFGNKKIYAGEAYTDTNKISADLFYGEEYTRLQKITNNFNYFFWWSDVPVYKRIHLEPFFNMIKYNSLELSHTNLEYNITYNHFDYIIYQYYLILTEGFEIVNTTPITNIKWSLEGLNTTDMEIFDKLQKEQYGFGWVTNVLYEANKEFLTKSGTFLIYHLDRS